VDVHLYFSTNRHILVWRTKGELVSSEFIEKYRARGMERVWIHREDEALWVRYLAHSDEMPTEIDTAAAAPEVALPDEPAAPPRTDEGRGIVELLQNETQMESRKQIALVAKSAREILADTASPTELPAQQQALAHARAAVRDILDVVLDESAEGVQRLVNELWKLSAEVKDLEHAANVATFAVLFSMAFGRIDQELIADIALASLLHDIGVSQVSATATTLPFKHHLWTHSQQYAQHVPEGMKLLNAYAPDLSNRIKVIVSHHHEKFDGSGYPQGLQGFQVDDIAQLVSMADTLESISSGQWDGEIRTIQESLLKLEAMEKTRNFPEHFNPEVFAAILRWMRDTSIVDSAKLASKFVRERADELIKARKN
jgi:HD-GYP domain-containing protein (c-di-GMP phosphodiesterase class II)